MSATKASPTNVSSGTRSIVAPPSTKWIGGSTWVPVWVLMEMTERLETSPRRMSDVRSIATTGSPG